MLADGELDSALTWCKTLTEALTFLRRHRTPVCVLLDLHLPDVHGLSAVNRILETTPDAAIVVLTGLAEAEAGLDAVAAGAQDYLVKGRIDPQALSRAVRYALQRKQVERAAAALRATQSMAQENARLERGLLPVPLLRDDGFEAVARYEPGRAHGLLSGDFYDVVQRPDGTVHAVIGDVSGHGAAEAALGVCLRVAWRTAVLCGTDQLEQLALLEEILVAERSDPHVFATVTSLVLPPAETTSSSSGRDTRGSCCATERTSSGWNPRAASRSACCPATASGSRPSTRWHPAPVSYSSPTACSRAAPDRTPGWARKGCWPWPGTGPRSPARPFIDALVSRRRRGRGALRRPRRRRRRVASRLEKDTP